MVRKQAPGGHILVVDDNKINLMMLTRALREQGYQVTTAENGGEALEILFSPAAESIDVVLLDILMPDLDGYQVLERIKQREQLHHIPVIMISALDEIDSVIRCIEMGATDYLHKPYNPALLEARINASLADKRLRDLEIEYLEQVGHVVEAAESIESSSYDPDCLDQVAGREDALGNLARVFQRMAAEIHLREQRLKQQLEQLRIDVEDMKKTMSEPLSVYIPMDRRQALVHGTTLPETTVGAALFVDVSGFTPLSETLAQQLGPKRGAEELTRILNQVYGALIHVVHQYHGAVVGFSGDAITCYFEQDEGLLAAACAIEMQKAMRQFSAVRTPDQNTFSLAVKISAVAGPVRRFLVGDPQIQNIEVLAGRTLDLLAAGEHLATRGEILVHQDITDQKSELFITQEERVDPGSGDSFHVLTGMQEDVAPQPWIELRKDVLRDEQCRPWLLPAVYEHSRSGAKGYLSEFRQGAALFLSFTGIDYDQDEQAGVKLDRFTRWVQGVVAQYDGSLLQLSMGDKGSYLYAVFGAPVAHNDDALRAVYAALALQDIPAEFGWIEQVKIGVTQGQMRTGSYGSSTRRTYGAQGDKVNLAARLMQVSNQGIICDRSIFQATQARLGYEELAAVSVKGVAQPLALFRPTGEKLRLERKQVSLIGRAVEQVELGRSLQSARLGPSKTVLLEGEAGSGKTRLVERFASYSHEMHIPVYRSYPDMVTDNLPFHAWRSIIWQLYDLETMGDDKDRLGRLIEHLNGAGSGPLQEADSALIESILLGNRQIGDLKEDLEIPRQAGEILAKLMKARIDSNPTAIIFEDAHELDAFSWELIQFVSSQVDHLVILVAFRPLIEPGSPAFTQLVRSPNTALISLKGLSREEAYLLACEHLEAVSLPQELAGILEGAAGNPRMIEEMVYIMRDDGYVEVVAGACQLLPHVDLDAIAFPTTPEGLIKSRLDRLTPSEQLTLKIASVIGEQFSLDVLTSLYPLDLDRPFIIKHLETFTNLDLVTSSGGNHTFTFNDEVTYQAVYNSMLFSQRRQLHRQLAEWIERNDSYDPPGDYALLAKHWRQADDTAKAIDYLEKAGQRALQQGDYELAERYFRECLELDATVAVLSTEFFKKKLQGENIQAD